MKGEWVYEEKLDRWHLVWNQNHPVNEAVGEVPMTEAWCHLSVPSEAAVTKPGERINGMADSVHDECFRKSEELE